MALSPVEPGSADDWRASPWLRRKVAVQAGFLGFTIGSLMRTTRVNHAPLSDLGPLFERYGALVGAAWHAQSMPLLRMFGDQKPCLITSRSRDGELFSAVVRKLGFDVVRGSGSRGAVAAMTELRRRVRAGQHVAVAVDGPRGPAYVVKPGVLLLAQRAGVPVVPVVAATDRHWTFPKSWDRFQIPKPFCRSLAVFGEPVLVPADADRDTLERARRDLEDRMLVLQAAVNVAVRDATAGAALMEAQRARVVAAIRALLATPDHATPASGV